MTQNVGLAWHVHHDNLFEWCFGYAERVAYIKSAKPKSEQATRLRLFRFVKNPPAAVVDARKAYDDARKACDDAGKACDDAGKACDDAGKAYDDARKACDDAGKACDDAGKACDDAGKAYVDAWKAYRDAVKAYDDAWKACRDAVAKAMTELEKLHAVECPNCPWNGRTIFLETTR